MTQGSQTNKKKLKMEFFFLLLIQENQMKTSSPFSVTITAFSLRSLGYLISIEAVKIKKMPS